MIIDGILVTATAPGTTGVAATVASPGSLTLQPDAEPELAFVLTMFQSPSAFLQITSPDGHDTTRGWRAGGGASNITAQLRTYTPKVGRGETLSVTIAGSATAGDIEAAVLAVAYPGLKGGDFIGPNELKPRHITSIMGSITPSTNGTWPSGTALSSIQDTLRANARYAVLGVEVGNAQNILCAFLTGPDTGWYRVPLPVADQFDSIRPPTVMPWLAAAVGRPLIPVFNSGNKSQTYLGLVANENGTARQVNLVLAQL